ncbi:helix-turn-helix domain-containing protein [Clostridium neonatale]|uniref:helix-turn-helix domain-containing protein n=1 Tax=Clostridium neonatale TaxID=137838 RepID=UPI00291C0A29|nr:helix-turn-helix transcriptional regulator [Clostridium neonatale]CAI3202468.1 hypothetical protein CNEO2_350025 [Clostridium neonatale]CAI3211253.1 hypothetical protein CNEO2_480024 [Clostridium neonatale]
MGLKENLKIKRKDLYEVSSKLNISKPTLQRYESGVISNIPSDKIEKLAKILNTTPVALMGWTEKYPYSVVLNEEEL